LNSAILECKFLGICVHIFMNFDRQRKELIAAERKIQFINPKKYKFLRGKVSFLLRGFL